MNPETTNGSHLVSIFIPSFGTGGVERMMVNLAGGISALGCPVDLVVRRADSPLLAEPDNRFRIVELDLIHSRTEKAANLYFSRYSPCAVLSSKEENDAMALGAREKSGINTRIVMRVPVNATSRLKNKRTNPVRLFLKTRKLKKILSKADALVAVSEGVAGDINAVTGIPPEQIRVIHNPVITPDMKKLASAPVDHPWLGKKDKPLVISTGRLGSQKNFEMLIEAFSRVSATQDSRLLILGEGRRRSRLEALIKKLGLEDRVELPGFITNPFAYVSKADLFVLSSLWEGSPNALTEALALGIPVVSTDCESGPREILQNGRYGRLTPVGDAGALASAIIDTLHNPLPAGVLRDAVESYSLETASRAYLEVLMGDKIGCAQDTPGCNNSVSHQSV